MIHARENASTYPGGIPCLIDLGQPTVGVRDVSQESEYTTETMQCFKGSHLSKAEIMNERGYHVQQTLTRSRNFPVAFLNSALRSLDVCRIPALVINSFS